MKKLILTFAALLLPIAGHGILAIAGNEDARFFLHWSMLIASLIGMLPMAFGDGIGSEMRVSCGLGVVGGLTFSAVMTVYLIPALYFIFTKKKTE